MLLLTSIYDNMPAGVGAEEALGDMVPRLFPFFRHTLTSVRLATLRCLTSLLLRSGTPTPWLQPAELLPALRLTFQNLVTEADAKVVEASKVIHCMAVRQLPPESLPHQPSIVRLCCRELWWNPLSKSGETVRKHPSSLLLWK